MKTDILTCAQACEEACRHYLAHSGAPADAPFRCPLGFTVWQVIILKHLVLLPNTILSYDEVAASIHTTYGYAATRDGVRGAMGRLKKKGQLKYIKTRQGMLQGFRILSNGLGCMALTLDMLEVNPAVYSTTRSLGPRFSSKEERQITSSSNPVLGTPHEQLLAMDDECIKAEFPSLFGTGFGSSQVRQIVQSRMKSGAGLDFIIQGLRYADWELQGGLMCDRHGETVSDPCSYLFKSLIGQGHYRRPKGYLSPEELAENERKEDAVRVRKALQARYEEAFEVWRLSLSAGQIATILGNGSMTPSLQRGGLRNHFEVNVWPDLVGRGALSSMGEHK